MITVVRPPFGASLQLVPHINHYITIHYSSIFLDISTSYATLNLPLDLEFEILLPVLKVDFLLLL
jgi:hypothetical protein